MGVSCFGVGAFLFVVSEGNQTDILNVRSHGVTP